MEKPLQFHSLQTAGQLISTQNYDQALIYCKDAQRALELAANQGEITDPDSVIATLHTLALCYQKTQRWEQCASYLDGCAYNTRLKAALLLGQKRPEQQAALKLRKLRYQARLHLQLCAVLSRIQRHQQALIQAKKACKYCSQILEEAGIASRKLIKKLKTGRPKSSSQISMVVKNQQVLEFLSSQFNQTRSRTFKKLPKLNTRNILGVQMHNDWTQTWSLANIAQIQHLDLAFFKSQPVLLTEFTKDLMFEKTSLIVSTFHSIGTELRLMEKQKKKGRAQSEFWFEKALNLAKNLLPNSSVLVNELVTRSRSKSPLNKSRPDSATKTPRKILKTPVKPVIAKMPQSPQSSSSQTELAVEPQVNLNSSLEEYRNNFFISSTAFYGESSSEEEDKYEYMPKKIPDRREDNISSTGGHK